MHPACSAHGLVGGRGSLLRAGGARPCGRAAQRGDQPRVLRRRVGGGVAVPPERPGPGCRASLAARPGGRRRRGQPRVPRGAFAPDGRPGHRRHRPLPGDMVRAVPAPPAGLAVAPGVAGRSRFLRARRVGACRVEGRGTAAGCLPGGLDRAAAGAGACGVAALTGLARDGAGRAGVSRQHDAAAAGCTPVQPLAARHPLRLAPAQCAHPRFCLLGAGTAGAAASGKARARIRSCSAFAAGDSAAPLRRSSTNWRSTTGSVSAISRSWG